MRRSVLQSIVLAAAALFAWDVDARADESGDVISQFAVRTPSGEYWSVAKNDDGQLRIFADEDHLGASEAFRIAPAPDERWRSGCLPNGARVLVTTHAGDAWSVDDRQLLVGEALASEGSGKDVFTLINETDAGRCFRYGDRISIVSAEDYYLSASPEGVVDADQKHRGGWEVFDLVDPANPAAPTAAQAR